MFRIELKHHIATQSINADSCRNVNAQSFTLCFKGLFWFPEKNSSAVCFIPNLCWSRHAKREEMNDANLMISVNQLNVHISKTNILPRTHFNAFEFVLNRLFNSIGLLVFQSSLAYTLSWIFIDDIIFDYEWLEKYFWRDCVTEKFNCWSFSMKNTHVADI